MTNISIYFNKSIKSINNQYLLLFNELCQTCVLLIAKTKIVYLKIYFNRNQMTIELKIEFQYIQDSNILMN